jgi:hypothetical protein
MNAVEARAEEAFRTHRQLRRYVLPTEKFVVATRRHWAHLLEPIATTFGAFLLVGAIIMSTPVDIRGTISWLWLGWLVVAVRFAWRWYQWYCEWFIATDKRLLLLYGAIVHRVAMMPLVKVTDMGYSRSMFGQLVGYGRFDMESAGQDQALRTINFVPDPDPTYRTLCVTIFGLGPAEEEAAAAAEEAPAMPPSILPFDPVTPDDGREPRPTTQPIEIRPDLAAPDLGNQQGSRSTRPDQGDDNPGGVTIPKPFF